MQNISYLLLYLLVNADYHACDACQGRVCAHARREIKLLAAEEAAETFLEIGKIVIVQRLITYLKKKRKKKMDKNDVCLMPRRRLKLFAIYIQKKTYRSLLQYKFSLIDGNSFALCES